MRDGRAYLPRRRQINFYRPCRTHLTVAPPPLLCLLPSRQLATVRVYTQRILFSRSHRSRATSSSLTIFHFLSFLLLKPDEENHDVSNRHSSLCGLRHAAQITSQCLCCIVFRLMTINFKNDNDEKQFASVDCALYFFATSTNEIKFKACGNSVEVNNNNSEFM